MALVSGVSRGVILAMVSTILAAAFLVPYRMAAMQAPAELVALAMLSVAALFNTLTNLTGRVRNRDRARPPRHLGLTLGISALLGTFTSLGNFAVAQSIGSLGPGLTSVVQQTQVVFVAVASLLLLGERITLRFVIGTAVALAGFGVMRLVDGSASAGPPETVIDGVGLAWATLAAMCFGLMHVIIRKVIHRIDPVAVNAIRLWLAAALLLAWPGRIEAALALSPEVWAVCAAAAFLGPFVARLCLMYAVRYISASRSALIVLAAPVFAFGFGFIAFGIVPTRYELLGGLLILAGITVPLLERAAATPPPPPAPEGSAA